ncbi:MAG: ABC-2 type transport system ATP-binding protein [Planctomycetota bacterium]|jgi:ABC-2 type transport system ATP-binding protein
MTLALSVKNLTKQFGGFAALDDVSFDVQQGSLFGLLGPNGAGKTTLFSIASGFLQATSGHAEVLGIDIRNVSALRGKFSILPQDADFQTGIQVIDQLTMFGRLGGYSKQDAERNAMEELEKVGLQDVAHMNAQSLSHGMSKRVALAQAFLGNPEVIILDEPTAGLDPDNARTIRELVRSMKGEKTVLLSSHNLQEIQDLCDSVVILNGGKVRFDAKMADITQSDNLSRISVFGDLPEAVATAIHSLPVVSKLETDAAEDSTSINVHFTFSDGDNKEAAMKSVLETLLSGGVVPRKIVEGASLEQRFLEVTDGKFDGASSS